MKFKRVVLLSLCSITFSFSDTLGDLGSLVEEVEIKKHEQKEFLKDVFKQRMRTQLMARDALLVATDFQKKKYLGELLENSKLFNDEIKSLFSKKEDISKIVKIVPDYPKRIERLTQTWDTFYKQIKVLSNDSNNEEALAFIISNNVLLLTDIDFILRKYIEFTKSSDTLAKAIQHKQLMLFSQVGMPRAYIQKIIKEKLLINYETKVIENRQNLDITINALDRLLKALREGDKTLGLDGTTEDKILEKLTFADSIWKSLKPLYQKELLSKEEFAMMLTKSEEFIVKYTEVITLSNEKIDQ